MLSVGDDGEVEGRLQGNGASRPAGNLKRLPVQLGHPIQKIQLHKESQIYIIIQSQLCNLPWHDLSLIGGKYMGWSDKLGNVKNDLNGILAVILVPNIYLKFREKITIFVSLIKM